MNTTILSVVLITAVSPLVVSGWDSMTAESTDCSTCSASFSNIREAIIAEDYARVRQILECMKEQIGIDGCADELCEIARSAKDMRLTLLLHSFISSVPRILYSVYGCEMVSGACSAFLHPEKYPQSDEDITLVAETVLAKVFRVCGYSFRPIAVYRLLHGAERLGIRPHYYRMMSEFVHELSDSEVFLIGSQYGGDPLFQNNAGCDSIRKRCGEIESQHIHSELLSKETVLRMLREQMEMYAVDFCDKYRGKEADPFSGDSRGLGRPPIL